MPKEEITYPWGYLAVEVAVKIQELLEPNEDHPPYEYINEADRSIRKVLIRDL